MLTSLGMTTASVQRPNFYTDILGLYFSYNLNWKLAKIASKKIWVPTNLSHPPQLLTLYRIIILGGFFSLCNLVSSFLPGHSIAAVVHGYCSSGFCPVTFSLPIIHHWSKSKLLVQSTLALMKSSCIFPNVSIQKVSISRRRATERLTFDPSLASVWDRSYLTSFNASKTQSSRLLSLFFSDA